MRQAVFSSLGARVVGAHFLDLFAGTGSYGLEALSRGAAGGVFIERNAKAAACLRENLASVRKSLGSSGGSAPASPAQAKVEEISAGAPDVILIEADALGGGWPLRAPDLVFVDPPYELIGGVSAKLFARLTEAFPDATELLIVFEAPGEVELSPPGWSLRKRLGKGNRQPTASIFGRMAR